MCLSGYTNAPTLSAFIDLRHVMEYLIHYPLEHIMHSRKNVFKLSEIPYNFFFKLGSANIKNSVILQLPSHIM